MKCPICPEHTRRGPSTWSPTAGFPTSDRRHGPVRSAQSRRPAGRWRPTVHVLASAAQPNELVSPVRRGPDLVAIDTSRLVFGSTDENGLLGSLAGTAAIVGPRDNHLPLAS